MNRLFTLLAIFSCFFGIAQVPAYYSSINFSQNGSDLKDDLSVLISTTHSPISYDECWDVLKVGDGDPDNFANVLLIYGHTDDGDPQTDRSRDKNNNGGSTGQWNREHVFPKSLGTPDLGSSGPGSDAHNLRASDVQQNGARGNRKFANGGGNAGNAGSNWYPGDEWKGDCARIVMYMYLRYGSQCLPSNCVIGTSNASDPNMIDLLLTWNVEDPVSDFEQDRNDAIFTNQNNRNPFIDNPYLATKIWGGTPAEDPWGGVSIDEVVAEEVLTIYPNPTIDGLVYFSSASLSSIEQVVVYSLSGKKIGEYNTVGISPVWIDLGDIEKGTYLLQIKNTEGVIQRKYILR